MPLLERGYRAAARTELERSIRELEDRDKAAQTRPEVDESASSIQSNIIFAQRLNLIDQQQAREMKKRVEKAAQYERFVRNETGERTDDIENPHERAKRFYSIDQMKSEISKDRAAAEAEHHAPESRGAEKGQDEERTER